MSKKINARIVQKHDIEANWLKAVNFIPMQGEIIVYDKDENYDYERIKVGDGVTLVSDLSFVADAIDERLDAVEAVVLPAKSVVSETLTSTYTVFSEDYGSVDAGTSFTVPDGYKCTSIKANFVSTFEDTVEGELGVNLFNQDPDTATSNPVIASVACVKGENIITEIPEECKVFSVYASRQGNSISEDSYTIYVEAAYEEISSRIDDIESKLTTVETDVSALETEVDTLETSLKAKLNIKADAENVNEAVSALDNGKVVSIVTDAFAGGYDEYIDDGIGKTYMLLDGCTSIEINITADFEGIFGGTWFNQNPDTATSNPVMGSYTLNKGENIITEIPEGCKAFSVGVNEITNSSSGYACTFDVKIVYEKASVIYERLTSLEDDVENSKPVTTINTSLTVPANSSVTYTTLWNDALVGLTAYTDHELTVHSNYLGSDLYVTDIDDMGYIGTSIETGVIYDVIADVRPRVNQGMPYPTDGGNLGLKFWNNTDTDIVVQIDESRLNEELLKYLVTTGQYNADKVFPSVDTFWSMDSLSAPISFTAKYTNMVVTHERNIYYYDPSGEYSESPSGKIGICRDYVAVNQQSATNCTRYQWFKDFEGNEYYRELTSGTVTQTVNDDGSYTWTISNWTVSSDWERIDVSRDEFEASVVNISQESPKSDSSAISSSYLSGEACYGSYRFYKPNNRTYFDPSLGYKRQTFFDAPSINGEGKYTGYIMNYMHGNTVNDDITIAQWFTNVQDNSMWYRNGTGSGLHGVDGDENGVWYAPQYVNFNEWTRIDAGATTPTALTLSISPSSFSSATSTNGITYYTANLVLAGAKASATPIADVVLSNDIDTAILQKEAYQCIDKIVMNDGSVTLYCFDSLPEVTFDIKFMVM